MQRGPKHPRSNDPQRATACQQRRHGWHLRQRWPCRICKLLNLKDAQESDGRHETRQSENIHNLNRRNAYDAFDSAGVLTVAIFTFCFENGDWLLRLDTNQPRDSAPLISPRSPWLVCQYLVGALRAPRTAMRGTTSTNSHNEAHSGPTRKLINRRKKVTLASSVSDTICVEFPFSIERSGRQLLLRMTLCSRVGCAALALVLGFARASTAQEAQISFRSTPFNGPSATPLFKVDIVDSPKQATAALPSVTVVETPLGPRMSNVALKLPLITLGDTAIASQIGDQRLPRSFSSSPWAGNVVMRPMRGLSFSTTGTTPVSVLLGRLDATPRPPQSSDTPGVLALAMGVTPIKEFSVAPRALVPMNSQTQMSVGTAIRAQVSPHVSFVSDVGAAGTTQHGWDPLAAAGVIGHWSRAEFETNVLRGASPVGTSNIATVGSLDREIVRGLVRSIPGMTISTQASWSRPASAPTSADTTVGSIGVAYNRLPIGVLTATHQDEDGWLQQTDTTSIEWRPKPVGGIVVRYPSESRRRTITFSRWSCQNKWSWSSPAGSSATFGIEWTCARC